jgi:predicted neuraminidase
MQTWSTDKGQHWSDLSPINVPNPNSGIDAVTLSNGTHVLIYNPLQKGNDWYIGRNVLTVAISNDGIKWQDIYILENEKEGEFSYPAIIQSDDKLVHITYTANRNYIKHVVLQIDQE